jgi:hypothetical protein
MIPAQTDWNWTNQPRFAANANQRAASKPNVSQPQAGKLALSQPADRVHFGQVKFGQSKNITGPIPPNSLVLMVPGLCSPEESIRPLGDFLKANGHSVHLLKSPFNFKGGSAIESTDWLTRNIDRIRLAEASNRYTKLLSDMKEIPHEERIQFLRERFQLKDNPMGNAVAQAALDVMFTTENNYQNNSDFTNIILKERERRKAIEAKGGALSPETIHQKLHGHLDYVWEHMNDELSPKFVNSSSNKVEQQQQQAALKKTIDHVLDQIAPRVVLVGHSMGGFVSMLTLFGRMHDTAMVIGLSAPGENGTDEIPSGLGVLKGFPNIVQRQARGWAEWLAPALEHMVAGSHVTETLKADHQPFNTTLIAASMPDNYDGLINESNAHLNDKLPGRMNVIVTPRQANIVELASETLHQGHRLFRNIIPGFARVEDYFINSSKFMEGVAYHCGLLQFHEAYWRQDGDLLRGILEAPKNKKGKYDYQQGVPDYAEAVQQIKRAIAPKNYEAERLHILNVLQDQLFDAQKTKTPTEYQKLLDAYRPLCSDLEAIQHEQQPIQHGVPDKARELLGMLDAEEFAVREKRQKRTDAFC